MLYEKNTSNFLLDSMRIPTMDTNDTLSFFGISLNTTSYPIDATTECANVYCVSDEQYTNMILDYIKPTTFEYCLIFVYIVVFLVGISGNFLVCFAVWRNHSMRTVTNYFIGRCLIKNIIMMLKAI